MARIIGVADIQRNIRLANWKNTGLVQDLRSHIAKLPQLVIGDALDGAGIFHNAGIRHKNTGNIGPVFVYIGPQCRCRQSTGHITSATAEHLNMAIRHDAVKTWNDYAAVFCYAAKRFVGMLPVNLAIEGKLEPFGGIEKIKAEVFRHKAGSEIFAAGDQLILADALLHLFIKGQKLFIDISRKATIGHNGTIALHHHAEYPFGADAVLKMGIAKVK